MLPPSAHQIRLMIITLYIAPGRSVYSHQGHDVHTLDGWTLGVDGNRGGNIKIVTKIIKPMVASKDTLNVLRGCSK
jgi:hypothetical protein